MLNRLLEEGASQVENLLSPWVKKLQGLAEPEPQARNLPSPPEPEPTTIEPIQGFDFNDALQALQPVSSPVPEIEDSWLTLNKDHKALTEYIALLDRHKNNAEEAAQGAIDKFEKDHRTLVGQQKLLFGHIFKAKQYIDCFFPDLERLDASAAHLPEHLKIDIPRAPTYLKLTELNKKYGLVPPNAGVTAGKILFQNGGLSNSDNVLGLAVVVGISLVRAKSNISKLKRVIAEVRGKVSNYFIEMKSTVETLELAHAEIVSVSARLKQAEVEILVLAYAVKKLWYSGSFQQLTPQEKITVQHLYFLLLFAQQTTGTKI